MYRCVLFDLGQVIVRFDLMQALNKILVVTNASVAEINAFFKSEPERLFTEGQLTKEEFFGIAKRELKLNLNIDGFAEIYNGIFSLDEKVAEIISELEGKVRLALLSNTNDFHFPYILKKFPIMEKFEEYVVSYEEKCQKPGKLIFEKTLKRLNLKSNEIIFIDDTFENIVTASQMGFFSVHHKSADDLRKKLLEAGVL